MRTAYVEFESPLESNEPPATDSGRLAVAALEYREQQARQGREVSATDAVNHVLAEHQAQQARRYTPQTLGTLAAQYMASMQRAGVRVSTTQAVAHIQFVEGGGAPDTPAGANPQALATMAREYQAQQQAKGRTISTTQAVGHVLRYGVAP